MIRSLIGKIYIRYDWGSNRLERIWKLAQVDFKKRYYNDKLGLLWALLTPLSQIFIYWFVFTRIFNRQQDNFALYLFCAILLWGSFTEASIKGSTILRQKRYLIENIQFDWIDLYYSHMIAVMMGFLFNIIAYCCIVLITKVFFTINFMYLPIVLLSWFFIGMSVSLLLSMVRPIFEDFVHIWNILLLMGFWASGVFFDGTFYFTNYTWFLYANPFVGLILNIRGCLLVGNEVYINLLVINLVYAIILFSLSMFLFRKRAKSIIQNL